MIIIVLFGPPGVGKSTLLKRIEEVQDLLPYKLGVLYEPTDDLETRNMIQKVYENGNGAFEVQLRIRQKRLEQIEMAKHKNYDVLLMDGSAYTDYFMYCYAKYKDGLINLKEYQLLYKWVEPQDHKNYIRITCSWERQILHLNKRRMVKNEENIPLETLRKFRNYAEYLEKRVNCKRVLNVEYCDHSYILGVIESLL